jgi:hypothetical protein
MSVSYRSGRIVVRREETVTDALATNGLPHIDVMNRIIYGAGPAEDQTRIRFLVSYENATAFGPFVGYAALTELVDILWHTLGPGGVLVTLDPGVFTVDLVGFDGRTEQNG